MEKHIVNTTSLFEVDNKFEDERFMKVRVAAMHSGINRNGSRFSVDTINAAQSTFANIPILAEVAEHTDANGNKYLDYTTHAMHVEQDAFDDEKTRIIYDEKVVGIVPETNNFELVHDDETGNEYIFVDALLYREYGNYCCDILESRDGKTDVSAEISCEDISYNAQDKCLDVGKMSMMAITLLGEDVKPGMAKAHAEVFSANETNRQDQLISIMQELKEALDIYNNNFRKEDTQQVENLNENLEEVLEDVNVEEVTSEETTEEVTTEEEVSVEENYSEDETTDTPDENSDDVEETVEEETEEEISTENVVEDTEESEPVVEENSLKFTVAQGETVKDFSISLSDKIVAIQNLVNETYSELDNEYYYCDVYEDEKYLVMHGWSKSYRQSFKCKKKCSYQLVGDRVEVFATYLSQDEITALENMKSNYSSIEDELNKYKAEPEKMEILNSEEYAPISNTEEFEALKNKDSHFDLSIDDVRAKADEILLSYAKSGNLNFAQSNNTTSMFRGLPTVSDTKKRENRYGNLFSK